MNFSSLKGRIALKALETGLLFFVLSLGLYDLLRPSNGFFAFVFSAFVFSVCIFLSVYIICAMELWPFKKLSELGRKDRLGRESLPAVAESTEEVREVLDVLMDLKDKKDEALLSQKRFLADASHEMRSPITIMKGNIEIALRRDRGVEEYKGVLTSNLEEIDRLERLVKDLMFLARADSSELILNMSPMRLDEVIESVCEGLGPLADTKGITLSFDNRGDSEHGEMTGDRDRLVQLFINLVENAIRYTGQGGRVTVGMSRVAGVLKATVEDTGMGIPQAELVKIFDRFYRVDKARSREAGGTGLGLCICKWIVDAHKGGITIESEEGVGTKVTLMFLPGDAA